jgi:Protein of unknown function (DUF3313)
MTYTDNGCHRLLPGEALSRVSFALALTLCLTGCAGASLEGDGSLSSYADLKTSNGILAKSKLYVSKDIVTAARTVRIVPASFSPRAQVNGVTNEQRKLISNAINRSLCANLGDKFIMVESGHADLTVYSRVTQMTATNEIAVAASKGGAIAKTVLLPGVPVPTPRIPIGLGSLSVEAEARGHDGRQAAAMIWGRGANFMSGSARISTSGDAYDLADAFGQDFSTMLITGKSPFETMFRAPSFERVQAMAGGKPKYAACEAFGREPGVVGLIGATVGVPPEWNDKGSNDALVTAEPKPTGAR